MATGPGPIQRIDWQTLKEKDTLIGNRHSNNSTSSVTRLTIGTYMPTLSASKEILVHSGTDLLVYFWDLTENLCFGTLCHLE